MAISNSHLSYGDCYALFDKAVEDAKGARAEFKDFAQANFFRMRCHQARSIDRRRNSEIYKPGDPLYAASPYDELTLRIKEDESGAFWVYAEKGLINLESIESLSDLED